MRLLDLRFKDIKRIDTLVKHPSCWECENLGNKTTMEKKKKIWFTDGSSVILCLEDMMLLLDMLE